MPAAGGSETDRSKAVADFIAQPHGPDATEDLPLVIGLQEMTKLVDPPVDYPAEIVKEVQNRVQNTGQELDSFFLPIVTMQWYPLLEKWKPRWDEGIKDMEQGLFTCAKGAKLLAPGLASPRDSWFKCLKLDLPLQEFALEFNPSPQPLEGSFQAAYYRGTRDTEPRAATAHGVSLSQNEQPGAQFIFLNVHLATLKAEDTGTLRLAKTDTVDRTVRRSVLQATALRHLQLRVLRDFILQFAYRRLKLPVIVAGDFNAGLEEPEVKSFLSQAFLKPVFDPSPHQCWKCGCPAPRGQTPSTYFTTPDDKTILTKTAEEAAALIGAPKEKTGLISATECCSSCRAPFFSHKRNFGLIDNIFHTDSDRAGDLISPLQWQLSPSTDGGQAAPNRWPVTKDIRLDTYFSDHLPIWCKFDLRPKPTSA